MVTPNKNRQTFPLFTFMVASLAGPSAVASCFDFKLGYLTSVKCWVVDWWNPDLQINKHVEMVWSRRKKQKNFHDLSNLSQSEYISLNWFETSMNDPCTSQPGQYGAFLTTRKNILTFFSEWNTSCYQALITNQAIIQGQPWVDDLYQSWQYRVNGGWSTSILRYGLFQK